MAMHQRPPIAKDNHMNTPTPTSSAPRAGTAGPAARRRRKPSGANPGTPDFNGNPQRGNGGRGNASVRGNGQRRSTGGNGSNGGAQRDISAGWDNVAPAQRPRLDLDAIPAPTIVDTTFAKLGVSAPLLAILAREGIEVPFPIQAATIPDALTGRDLLGRGKTGSGKTIAFAIPTVMTLAASERRVQPTQPRALVLVPTRELANQVAETMAPLAKALGLKVTTVYGGVGQGAQVAALRAGVDIVVACPGRLEDLIAQRHCRLDRIEVTVLDEADHMADLGFLPGVKRIMDLTPVGTQRLLFSATLDNGIDVLVRRYLHDPVVHSVDPEAGQVTTMTHHVFAVSAADKPAVVTELAQGQERVLLFMRTKHGAKKLAKQLSIAGIPAVELHGNLSQNARERNLEAFSEGSTKVLVATDIAARGIHVDNIALVVHVDPPAEHKAFLHRSGRTARAGAEGVVVTVMTPDQAGDVRSLARAAGIRPIVTPVAPGHAQISSLVGPPAPRVAPRPEIHTAAPAGRPQGRPNGGRPNGGRSSARPQGAGRPQRAGGAGASRSQGRGGRSSSR
jgi:superfamily II DNA/RNA helicase